MSLIGYMNSKQALRGAIAIRQGIDGKDGEFVFGDSLYAPAIYSRASGEVVATTDSAKAPLKNIRLFGKSTQDGTPSIEAPQPINHLGESGSIVGKVLSGNVLPYPFVETTKTNGGITFTDNGDGTITVNGTATTNVDFVLYGSHSVTNNSLGDNISLQGCLKGGNTNSYFINTSLFKDGSKVKELQDVGNGVSIGGVEYDGIYIHIRIRSGVTLSNAIFKPMINHGQPMEYQPYTEQPFTVLAPNGLHGNNGVSDYVDFEKGVLVRHFAEVVFDGSDDENWKIPMRNVLFIPIDNVFSTDMYIKYNALCNQYVFDSYNRIINQYQGICIHDNNICVYDNVLSDGNVTTFKEHLKQNPLKVVYQLAEPIETPLTEEEMAQFKALCMNYPNTTIINSNNAYMEVEYVADTKIYIDNKFKELAVAIVSQ